MALLQDKVVLVTGAGAGIGKATALAMAEAGATVAAADIDAAAARAQRRRNRQQSAPGAGDRSRLRRCRQHRCDDLAVVDEFGRLDTIVNNAGVTRFAAIMDLTEADWDRIHRVNAKGVFFCLQRAAREMLRKTRDAAAGASSISPRSRAAAMPARRTPPTPPARARSSR